MPPLDAIAIIVCAFAVAHAIAVAVAIAVAYDSGDSPSPLSEKITAGEGWLKTLIHHRRYLEKAHQRLW